MLNEPTITLAAKLFSIRENGRQLLGDKYESKTADCRRMVKALAEDSHKGDLLAAYTQLLGDLDKAKIHSPGTELMLTCALVDLMNGIDNNPEQKQNTMKSLHAYIARDASGKYMLLSKPPVMRFVGASDLIDLYVDPGEVEGDQIGIRHLCSGVVNALGIDIPRRSYISIELTLNKVSGAVPQYPERPERGHE